MYAVIEVSGKQFKVQKGERFKAEGMASSKIGSSVAFDKALLVKEGNTIHVGTPYVKGASVSCTVVKRLKGAKVTAFKYRRRKDSKKKIGSRQHLIELEVKEISTGK
ncbi:MAG: 50S ribosomal protein L21 [Candidatus Omnitrophota bacterium]